MLQKIYGILRKLPPLSIPLVAAVVVYNSWFLNLGVRTAGDWGFLLKSTADTLRRFYFTTWLSDNQFGRVLIDAGQAPTYALYGWLSYNLNTSYALNERLVHMWPAVIVAIVGSYLLVKYIFNDKATAILGVVVYSANTYYLALLTGHLTLAVAYAFAPLVILFYLKALNMQKTRDVILCALLFAVCGAYEPRSAYILTLILILLAAFHFFLLFLPKHHLTLRTLVRMSWIYGGPLMIFGLLNAYWVLGLAFAGGGTNTAISSSLFGNEFFNTSEALTLFHPFWSGGQIRPFVVHPIPVYFWLIPLVAISGFIVNNRNRTLLFFALLGVIGILLAKQSDEPLASLYHWLFVTVPGFNAFREASKFYLLTALSYAVLIPGMYWYAKKYYPKRVALILFIGICLLFLPNLKPMITNEIGATFSSRSMPKEYVTLNHFLDSPDYSRVLWVPEKPRWALANAKHPPVTPVKLLGESWKSLATSHKSNTNGTVVDEVTDLLQQEYMPLLLSNAGIKYVIVPMRDLQNSDNFFRNYGDDPTIFSQALSKVDYLKEAELHIEGFKIYETVQPEKPYFSSLSSLYSINDARDLPAIHKFWTRSVKPQKDFNFVVGNENANFTTDIRDLFGQYGAADIHGGEIPLLKADIKKTGNAYYFDQNYGEAFYKASRDRLTFGFNSLIVPGANSSKYKASEVTVPLSKDQEYILENHEDISPVDRTSETVYMGSPRNDTTLYAVTPHNLVPHPTIKDSLWQKEVENCVPYGTSVPRISMNSEIDTRLHKPVLTLFAKDHAACTGPPSIAVKSGTHLLSFQYRGVGAQILSYKLVYNTSDKNKNLTKDIAITDNGWHTYSSLIQVPSDATQLEIQLLGRPSNQSKTTASTRYTGLSLLRLDKVTNFKTATGDIQKTEIKTTDLQQYKHKGYVYHNLIPNGSFETGLWKKQVGDCNAYDDNPALKMSLSHNASDGHNALRLEAKRHIACTNVKNIKVQGGASYLLQFDYQSPNAKNAAYTVTLGGKNTAQVEQNVPILDTKWHTYKRIITMPPGTDHLSLAVAAYSSDENQTSYLINNYDNFILQQVPDISNRFYSVTTPNVQLDNPKTIKYQTVSNTLKKVTITGANKPFILLMSEQHHPSWQLLFDGKVDERLGHDMPWSKRSSLPSSYHLKVNGFENAWYLQPKEICQAHRNICTHNADGTYTMQLIVQFGAQRWFNLGLLITIGTIIGCILVLISLSAKRKVLDLGRYHDTSKRNK